MVLEQLPKNVHGYACAALMLIKAARMDDDNLGAQLGLD
jgi:hypothetical protein